MPIAKTAGKAASQARLAQMARAVKSGSLQLSDIQPAGLRQKVASMASATTDQLQTIQREARAKAGSLV